MKIVSLLLSVHRERLSEVRVRLSAMPGVQVHGEAADSKLVVTIEDARGGDLMPQVLAAQGLPGVLAATLTYEYCDDETISLEKRS
ncbi:MAG TPA: chaperone NapD [Burkholderiaceae bacterium]|jgi:nitrate reductase NapD|nr:chaperone NapD [Burkholderiaceae bacterium]